VAAAASQAVCRQPIRILSSFSQFFIYSGKQGGGATVLRRADMFLVLSLNINNLGKAAVLHFAFAPFAAGVIPNSACR
jgi:hypothetical protein